MAGVPGPLTIEDLGYLPRHETFLIDARGSYSVLTKSCTVVHTNAHQNGVEVMLPTVYLPVDIGQQKPYLTLFFLSFSYRKRINIGLLLVFRPEVSAQDVSRLIAILAVRDNLAFFERGRIGKVGSLGGSSTPIPSR